jgi:peptide/nickel transport system permease protein
MADVAREARLGPALVSPPPPIALEEVDEHEPGRLVLVWRRFRSDYVALAALAVVALLILIALAAPLVAEHATGFAPERQSLLRALRPPGAPNYLGTDELGRDVLTRLVYGARVSLGVAGLTVAIALTLGALLGSLAGYYGGWTDSAIMRAVDALQSIPSLFILIFISVIFNVGPVSLAFVIASLSWTGISRLVRAEVLSLRGRDFVVAARALGAGDLRLILRHVIPNVVPVMIVWATLAVGNVILAEATLSYLGLGVQPPTPSWGNMLTNSQQYFYRSITLVLAPGVAIFVTVLAVNIVGNALRDALDPRVGRR